MGEAVEVWQVIFNIFREEEILAGKRKAYAHSN